MTTSIIKIGNSSGVIIPSRILKRMDLKMKDTVRISYEAGRVVISRERDPFEAISKGGWYDDPRDSHAISDDLHKSRINDRDIEEL